MVSLMQNVRKMQTAKLEKGKIAMSIQCVRQAAITRFHKDFRQFENLVQCCDVFVQIFLLLINSFVKNNSFIDF
jgi:hypothetical protein